MARNCVMVKIVGLFVALLSLLGCNPVGPQAMGGAGDELLFMAPYDKIKLDNGKVGYVDSDGMLRGITETNILAAGRQMRDVVSELARHTYFDKYSITQLGPRYVDVRGSIRDPGKYEYPVDEDWNIMDLVQKANGFPSQAASQDFLLVRKSWKFNNAMVFVRGEAIPSLEGIGGDELHLFANDTILFPGNESLVYVFGSVKTPVCFTFDTEVPTLAVALEHAGGLLKTADPQNVQIYRVLTSQGRKVMTVELQREKNCLLEAWDVVYVPPQVPRSLLGNERK